MLLRPASPADHQTIWLILQQAIEQRRLDGSKQWQNGYPNEQTIREDMARNNAYVLVENEKIIAYAAIIFDGEPTYQDIDGAWLTAGDYVTIHRVATSNAVKGRGVATQLFGLIEAFCVERKALSIRADTNFDNVPMLKILDRLGYTYCGQIVVSTSPRRAYEKVLLKA